MNWVLDIILRFFVSGVLIGSLAAFVAWNSYYWSDVFDGDYRFMPIGWLISVAWSFALFVAGLATMAVIIFG